MLLRKMKPEEHSLTRPLWEKVFMEDSKEFLDYYYSNKTKHNEIYYVLCFEFTMNYSYTNKNSDIVYLPMQTDKISFFIIKCY